MFREWLDCFAIPDGMWRGQATNRAATDLFAGYPNVLTTM